MADPLYGTRYNRRYLQSRGIHFAGKPPGWSKKVTAANREELQQSKEQRREDYRQRIPIEGRLGQGTNGYRLHYICAKRTDTSAAWINSICLVTDLLILLRLFFALCKKTFAEALLPKSRTGTLRFRTLRRRLTDRGVLSQIPAP